MTQSFSPEIDLLLDKMSLEEQAQLLSGADFWTTASFDHLAIPKIKVSDGPNGARGGGSLVNGVKSNCYPCAVSVGASWNVALAYALGSSLADEARAKGARVLLAPTVNIHRSGLNGRNFECYSEDPCLTSDLAVSYIKGLQDKGVGATIKHFVGNDSEIQRQTMSSDIDERALREIYLRPFEAAVKEAGVWAVMTGYNRLNGQYMSEQDWAITTVLRQDWGFDGVVMSDWFGSHSTAQTVNAGLDLEMPGPTRDRGEKLVDAVNQGAVAPAIVRNAAGRILTLVDRVGAFEAPGIPEEAPLDQPEIRQLIREMAAQGSVLLKNDSLLPLTEKDDLTCAVIGPNAAQARMMGGGSARINALHPVTPLEGLQARLGPERVVFAEGCKNNRLIPVLHGPLKTEFFKGPRAEGEPLAVKTDPAGEFFWFDLPHKDLSWHDFSVRITGSFTPDISGPFVIGMTNAGFATLFLDGTLCLDGTTNWQAGENFFGLGNSERRVEVTLEAGRSYQIVVEYRPNDVKPEGIDIRALRFGIEPVLPDQAIQDAVALAANADVALLFVGRQGEWDTEGLDLPDMDLPGRQNALISQVAEANPNTVIVLQTGGPILMPWLPQVKAVLQMWYPGQELGHAVADILFGQSEPSGRLPQTFPKRMADMPVFTQSAASYPGENGHVSYDEGVFVGYRHFDRISAPDASESAVLFPFGFGLSYTEFAWSEPNLTSEVLDETGISAEVSVTNTGARSGSEVVQIYMRPLEHRSPRPAVDRPLKELVGFQKVHLRVGETRRVSVQITLRDLSYYCPDNSQFQSDKGLYELCFARSAADEVFTLPVRLEQDWSFPN